MFGREEKISGERITAVQYFILGVFVLLTYGLWRLQILGSEQYSEAAERNRIREFRILAPRGKILDRESRILVDNYPSFSALLARERLEEVQRHIDALAAGLSIDPAVIRDRLRRSASAPTSVPIIIKDDITPDDLAFIESHKNEYPELETIMVHRRLYPKNGFAAHLIGYVGEVSDAMLDSPAYQYNNVGDVVGRSGVEQYYNDLLIGKDGSRRVVVTSRGKEVERLSENPATPGKQLRLTIDLDLQIAAEMALEGNNGAIVAMDPRTGEILAMASRPTFDPNAFAVRITRDEWTRLVSDPGNPLLNKAIQAQLAPGSVFKIIMATAGLQEDIAQHMVVNCGGGANFYGRFFKCWVVAEHRTHGAVDISKAIYQSCDTYFYTLAERLGIGRIAKYASDYGLGQRTGIDLPQEVSGVMPSEEWKIRNFKQKWYAGETISVGIGQGAVATSPIQLARAFGAITSGGVLRRPHVAFPDQLPPERYKVANYTEVKQLPMTDEQLTLITDAMAGVVSPIGTAPSAALKGIDFAGKTGSAQVISNAARAKLSGHEFKDNGWFVGVTPRSHPEIVVVVLIEQGEHGYLAARQAAKIIQAYVTKKNKRQAETQVARRRTRPEDVQFTGIWSSESEHGAPAVDGGTFRVGDFLAPMAATVPPLGGRR